MADRRDHPTPYFPSFSSQAIEYSQKGERVPSCIIDPGGGWGGLYHGGFKAVTNSAFLKEAGVSHVVNTAKGLEIFGKKYLVSVRKNRGVKVRMIWHQRRYWCQALRRDGNKSCGEPCD